MRLGGAVYGARVRIYGGWDGLLWWSVWAGGLGEWWVAYGLCPKSRGRRTRALSFEVHPAGKFQWHFTCGFDFRHSLWLPFVAAFAVLKGLLIVPVGTMGPFWPGDRPLRAVRGVEGWVGSGGREGEFRWCFTCGFDFGRTLWWNLGIIIVAVGTMGPF